MAKRGRAKNSVLRRIVQRVVGDDVIGYVFYDVLTCGHVARVDRPLEDPESRRCRLCEFGVLPNPTMAEWVDARQCMNEEMVLTRVGRRITATFGNESHTVEMCRDVGLAPEPDRQPQAPWNMN